VYSPDFSKDMFLEGQNETCTIVVKYDAHLDILLMGSMYVITCVFKKDTYFRSKNPLKLHPESDL